jgi:hypothetical protein
VIVHPLLGGPRDSVAMKLYNRPFHWWGDMWTKPGTRTLEDLIDQGVLDSAKADWLVNHIRTGKSLLVAAEASRAGKSTLAYALLQKLPGNRERIYIRGTFEPFDWLKGSKPEDVVLLVNEFSPDLPVYCWGAAAKRVLELSSQGYQVIGCMHGLSVAAVMDQLSFPAVGATPAEVASLDAIAFRNASLDLGHRFNGVSEIDMLGFDSETNELTSTPLCLNSKDLPVR